MSGPRRLSWRLSPLSLAVIFLAGVACLMSLAFGPEAKAAGASLFLTPASGTYTINKKFTVAVKVNSGGQVVNAAEGTISFDPNLLEASGVSKSGSIFTLWTAEPAVAGGTIRFGGGIPRPGYNGTAGPILTITFKAKRAGDASVRFTGGAVLANDGKGTNILASMGSAKFTISPASIGPEPAAPTGEPAEKAEPEYNTPAVTSPTHPDQNLWYKNNIAEFKWDLPGGVTEISLSFDQIPQSEPGLTSDRLINEYKEKAVKDGVWYFHLKYKDSRRWGTTAHFRVMVDTKPPEPFEVRVRQVEVGDWPELYFEAKDETSGIKIYEVIIGSLEEKGQVVEAKKPVLKVSDLEVGEHTALVKAIDKAGNEMLATVNFKIEPIEAPIIRNYPADIKSTDLFYLDGTSLADITVNIFVGKDNDAIVKATTTSDSNGHWLFLNKNVLPNGRYVAWAEAVNNRGLKSKASNKVTFLVSPPIFVRIGSFVINYFTVFVSLLFLIILIIALIVFLAGWLRRKLKKETVEVEEVLRKNLGDLEGEIDQDLEKLDKARSGTAFLSEKTKVRQRLKENFELAEKKILKEIKDVEDILK